ncbi:hypothetical protein MBLNU230_g1988t1 [Neophaeotheca triangularis]
MPEPTTTTTTTAAATATATKQPSAADNDEKQHAATGDTIPQDSTQTSATNSITTSPQPSKPLPKWLQPLSQIYNTLAWTPPAMRWDPENPPNFSLALNILFGFAGAFTVANLYYSHPILNILAADFDVPYEKVAQIPTLAQAGYAVGLLFLCPLGDLFKRRPFVLWLVFGTASFSIGLCVTESLAAFSAITFLTGIMTVTPQLMLPLVGDLAPPHRRASALSIVVSGLMLGILIARLLSGIVTEWTSWRNVYWLSVGMQYTICFLLYWFMPDYPSTNTSLNYFKLLWSILVMLTKHAILVQACLISFLTSATFTNFWTVLTFLLSDDPYNYSSLVIGLFALIGIASMCLGPFYARLVIDRFVPLFSVVLGLLWCLLGVTIGTYTGTFTVAGPVLQAFFNDFGMQTAQIANRSAIYSIEPKARNRVNTAFMVATFCGQLVGTTAGSHLYARGGWVVSGSYSVASIGVALLVVAARGPWETGWVGWGGGWSIFKQKTEAKTGEERVKEQGDVDADLEKGDREPQGLVNEAGRALTADADREMGADDAHPGKIEREGGRDWDDASCSSKSREDAILPSRVVGEDVGGAEKKA